MADPRWDRLQRLFQDAIAFAPVDRTAFIDEACRDDADLRRQLDSLLVAHDAVSAQSAGMGFLESLDPIRAAALLEPPAGPARIGRYHVVRRLGQGGMGVVYLAMDPALDRPVAVKLLSGAAGADPASSRRLLDEARAASALDHPNIGTVYEVGEAADGPFIAMAYYEGQTLRERIERGPVPPSEAADLAAQVADGLAAAHASGIVHRDIKPENLIIGPGERVRIVDFGVARVDARTVTRSGGALGTVAYMSPEQTRGERVDGRTDIWALGIVLHEMLTGTRPFRGEGSAALIYGIRNDSPPALHRRCPEAPEALAAVVDRCLQKDPDGRFDSAADLATALRSVPHSPPSRGGTSRRRLRVAAAVAAVLALVALGAGVALGGGGLGILPTSTLADRGVVTPAEPIVLADFTAEGPLSGMARTVTEALRIDLHQSPVLRLAEAHQVAAALRLMGHDPAAGVPESIAREIAVREGHKAVIIGDVGSLGGRYILTARIVAADDGATLAAFRETARDSTAIIDAVDRLSKTVRREAGESLRSLRGAEPLPRVATASLPALRLYAEALRNAWAGGDEARTAALLEETVSLDSAFAGAYRSLATTYWNMRADRSRIADATRTAYRLRDRLPDRERYLIEAAYHWQLLGDPPRAREAYRSVLALDPDDTTARANLALAMLFEGEPVEAERVLRQASATPDGEPPAGLRLNLARALYFQGRTEEALAVIDSVADHLDGSPAAAILRIRFLGGDHRWEEAESAGRSTLAEYGADPQVRAETLRSLWHLALARGRLAAADTLFSELDALLHRIGAVDARARATIQNAESRLTLAGAVEDARAEIYRLLGQDDLDILTAGATLAPRAAAVLAAVGDTAAAARLVDTWEALPPEERGDPDTFSPELARARIDLAAGLPDQAAERLERASRGTIQAIHYLPDLAIAYRRAGRADSATAVVNRYLGFRHTRRLHRIPAYIGPALARAAELHEEAADTAAAIAAHAQLIALWSDSDPALQPRVEHARQRVAALSTRDR